MIKYFLSYLLLLSICISCGNESGKSNHLPTEKIIDTISGSSGQEIVLEFYTKKEEMVLLLENKKYVLKTQKPGSGIWYKGESFEVRGKGEEIEVYKNGKLMFKK